MKTLFKPYNLLLYVLAIIVFFFVGIIYAGLIDAGKEQGLAAAAIVLGYGFIASCMALIGSIIMALKLNAKTIININKALGIILLMIIGYFMWNYYANVKPKRDNPSIESPQSVTEDAPIQAGSAPSLFNFKLSKTKQETQDNEHLGLGLFQPNTSKNNNLYFYSNPIKSSNENEVVIQDSVVINVSEYNQPEIASAPPYLVPAHLKLDYNIFYFKVISETKEYYEIIINKITNQTTFVSKDDGDIVYWPQFFLNVNSVDFNDLSTKKVYVKPLNYAGEINTKFTFMKPRLIKDSWMFVELLDENLSLINSGWIKWQKDGNLLINYSLLS